MPRRINGDYQLADKLLLLLLVGFFAGIVLPHLWISCARYAEAVLTYSDSPVAGSGSTESGVNGHRMRE